MTHKVEANKKVSLREEVFVAYSNMDRKSGLCFSASEICIALEKKGIEFRDYELAALLTDLVREKIFTICIADGSFCLQPSS